MSIVRTPLSIPSTIQSLSSLKTICGHDQAQFLAKKLSSVSLTTTCSPFPKTMIRMGGGPRTYPGGVSKWQWKRMQAKKAKQLLKARLARERQIYEMRKRAELKAAVSELERPWEVVEKAPTLFSVSADEQLKVLADRFQKPGGFDMWSERDGPELFKPHKGLPSARFFPKGVVHSTKPYENVEKFNDGTHEGDNFGSGIQGEGDLGNGMRGHLFNEKYQQVPNGNNGEVNFNAFTEKDSRHSLKEGNDGKAIKSNFGKNKYKRRHMRDSAEVDFRSNAERKHSLKDPIKGNMRLHAPGKAKNLNLAVYDLNLHDDGSFGFQAENRQ